MKKPSYLKALLSDSDVASLKRLIGLVSAIMIIAYGIRGLFLEPFNTEFAIFYISILAITVWIAFKFMSADKILKYNVLGSLSKFVPQKIAEQFWGSTYPTNTGLDVNATPVEPISEEEPK